MEVGSGKNNTERPFTQALEAVRYRADGIVAAKLDRLWRKRSYRVARHIRDVLELVEDVLQPEKKAPILLDLRVDTSTPMGTLILTVMAAVATFERSVINQRTQGGRRLKMVAIPTVRLGLGRSPKGLKRWAVLAIVDLYSPHTSLTFRFKIRYI
jgi:site-specific DNA recombinase